MKDIGAHVGYTVQRSLYILYNTTPYAILFRTEYNSTNPSYILDWYS